MTCWQPPDLKPYTTITELFASNQITTVPLELYLADRRMDLLSSYDLAQSGIPPPKDRYLMPQENLLNLVRGKKCGDCCEVAGSRFLFGGWRLTPPSRLGLCIEHIVHPLSYFQTGFPHGLMGEHIGPGLACAMCISCIPYNTFRLVFLMVLWRNTFKV